MKLTKKQVLARITAYEECMEHLELEWTDDPTEREQGSLLIKKLTSERDRIIEKYKHMNL